MKMFTTVTGPAAGTIAELHISVGATSPVGSCQAYTSLEHFRMPLLAELAAYKSN